MEVEAKTGMCSGYTVAKGSNQADWREKQPSQVACVSEGLRCWGAWDTICGSISKGTIDHLEERDVEREVLEDLPLKRREWSSSARRTLKVHNYIGFSERIIICHLNSAEIQDYVPCIYSHSSWELASAAKVFVVVSARRLSNTLLDWTELNWTELNS